MQNEDFLGSAKKKKRCGRSSDSWLPEAKFTRVETNITLSSLETSPKEQGRDFSLQRYAPEPQASARGRSVRAP